MTDNPNAHYRDSLTIRGQTCSAQVRGLGVVALHHFKDAPRSTEDDRPYLLPTLDAVLLRDVLNAATDRGLLPPLPQGRVLGYVVLAQRPDTHGGTHFAVASSVWPTPEPASNHRGWCEDNAAANPDRYSPVEYIVGEIRVNGDIVRVQ